MDGFDFAKMFCSIEHASNGDHKSHPGRTLSTHQCKT